MRRVIATIAVLAVCLGVAWADRPPIVSPTSDDQALFDYSVGSGEVLRAVGPGMQAGADHIVGLQCVPGCDGELDGPDDAGWKWPHGGCPANTNITGPIGSGVLYAYSFTGDPDHLTSATRAGEHMRECVKFGNGTPAFATFDPYFLMNLGGIYSTHAEVGFFDALTAGTYRLPNEDTAGFIARVQAGRAGTYINLLPWEFSTLVTTAATIGNAASGPVDLVSQRVRFRDAVLAGLNTLDSTKTSDLLGLAGAVRGLALDGTTSFPAIVSPNHLAITGKTTLCQLADILAAYQNSDGSWSWRGDLQNPIDPTDKDTQTTAYAVMALLKADVYCTDYSTQIAAGRDWLSSMQLTDGGFLSYPGGGENVEVEGEALNALATDVSYTVSGWGPTQYPGPFPPPPGAPHSSYPGDTVQFQTYTGTLNLTPGTYVQKINTLLWTVDWTYNGTNCSLSDDGPPPGDWPQLLFPINAARTMSFGAGPASSLSQTGLLKTTWFDDYITVNAGSTSTFFVSGYEIKVTAGALPERNVWNSSGSPPWIQPNQDVMATFEVIALPSGALVLVPNKACYNSGDTVTVQLWMYDVLQAIVGGQFFLQYNTSELTFVSATATSPFALMYLNTSTPGLIDYSVQIPPPGAGVTGDAQMAVLTFTASAPLCAQTDLITWRAHDPPTRLSDYQGQAVYPNLVDMDVIDTVPPVINCPADITVECDESKLPVHTGSATATDNCDPAPAVTYSDGANLCGCGLYTGKIMRTWTATDACGNSSHCAQVITVVDTKPPTVTPPASMTVECDGLGNVAALNAWKAGATANDTCTGALTPVYVQESNVPGCGGELVITAHWTATDACGNVGTSASRTFTIDDTTPPVIDTCPGNITVNADAGQCSASVTFGGATAHDVCNGMHPTEPITYWIGATQIASPHVFPSGPTTVTVKATDACGNVDSSCSFVVTVNAFNNLVVTVELSPNIAPLGTLTRCITFELWDCDPLTRPVTVTKEVVFNVTNAGGSPTPPNVAIGTATLTNVPCRDGGYECMTARDKLHTLRRTATLTTGGTEPVQYVANFTGNPPGGDWLIGGNLNDDYWIDILDFGVLSWKYGTAPGADTTCSTTYPHADISGDGVVGLADFTFIQINFLKSHEANCCGQGGFRGEATEPITSIAVADLIAQGLGELAAGDINGDGWLDEADMAAFAAGLPPPVQIGDLNCDGAVDFGDINPFVMALSNPAAWQQAYPECNLLNADANADGNVDFGDINPFIALLQQ